MSSVRLIPLLLVFTIALVGCRSASSVQEDPDAAEMTADGDGPRMYTQAVYVLVDGDDIGMAPMTVRVRRSFGTREVTLWQAGDEIRTYEIEMVHTSEGLQTQQGFWSTPSTDGATYDVRNLPTAGETTFLVPYSDYPIKIEDQAYGITLLVTE